MNKAVAKSNSKVDMLNGPLLKKIIVYTIPVMLSGMLQLAYNAADTVVVGQFAENGTNALAAVGSTASLINLFVNICMGFSTGANVVVARYYGADAKEDVRHAVHTAYAISIISGAIMSIIGFTFAPTLLRWVDCPDNVINSSILYMRIIFCGMIFQMIYNFSAGIVRASGDTKNPFIILVISGLLNVVLNIFFVIVFHMDVAGVALATIISNALSAILITILLIRSNDCVKLKLSKIRINIEKLKEIARIGIPSCIQSTTFTLSNTVLQSAINGCGDTVMAACTSAASVENFVYIAMNAFYHTSIAFVGQNHAVKKYDRVKKILFICLGLGVAVGAVLGSIVLFFAQPIMKLYSPNDMMVIEEAIKRMSMIIPSYILCGILDVLVGCIRGMKVSFIPMISSIIGVCGTRFTWALVVFPHFQDTFWLYISYPISWLLTDIFHACTLIFLFRKFKSLMPDKEGTTDLLQNMSK